jgi:hypothetical protein
MDKSEGEETDVGWEEWLVWGRQSRVVICKGEAYGAGWRWRYISL